jgi:phenylalanyl-tRNA synthetase beta chain
MKVSYNWLKDYVKFDLSPQILAEKLTMAGLEVEEVIPLLPAFKGISVGLVLKVEKHPNADKLSVCEVDTGKTHLPVICGAPNVKKDQHIAFAPAGTRLPIGITIKKAKIRGIESFGMICSEEELGLEEKSSGIWVLPDDYPIGTDIYSLLSPTQDYVLDISITPNRPDAMSMIGIAREVAALLSTNFNQPAFKRPETSEKAEDFVTVKIESSDGCPRYAARVIRNVKPGPSPSWMADRLKAGGIRPINNIVDITNYVLLELGQPLHAFDLSQITGSKIIVRESKTNEKFITLDEKERELPPKTVMICDADKTVAIGGIMGGLNSEVSENTKDILLESAYFNPVSIGRASKILGLSSEASQRFERGVDPNGIPFACDRAAFLMASLAGGEVLKGIVDVYPKKFTNKKIHVRPKRVNHLLGIQLDDNIIASILGRLDIKYENETAVIPTFRPDLEREVDLIEEVARLINFDNIPVKENTKIKYDIEPNKDELIHQMLKTEIREQGYYEVITNSMVAHRELREFDDGDFIKIMNPISDDMNVMRRSLIPGLLKIAAYNINRSAADLHLFEHGRVFLNSNIGSPGSQPYYISGLIHGAKRRPGWFEEISSVDFYDIKGSVETYLEKIFLDKYEFILYDNTVYFDHDQVLGIKSGEHLLGQFGLIKQEISRHFDIDSNVFGFELSVDLLKEHLNFTQFFEMFSRFPFIEKDLSLVIESDLNARTLENLIYQSGKPLVKNVEIFDLFQSKQLGESKKSIAFRIRFQSSERTLNEKEVSKIFNKIIGDAERSMNAKLRE